MANFIEKAGRYSPSLELAWLNAYRQKSKPLWLSQSAPTRKTEAWKYTSLKQLEKLNYFESAAELAVDEESLKQYFAIEGLDASRVVFLNGVYSEALSDISVDTAQAELKIFSTSSSADGCAINEVVDLEKHIFASLNTLNTEDGLELKLKANQVLSKPLHVVSISTRAEKEFHINPRVVVTLGANSKMTLVEHFVSDAQEQNSFCNAITEFKLGDGAHLEHYRLQDEQESALHIGGIHADLSSNASLNSFYMLFGSQLKRLDIVVNHNGQGAHSQVNGVYLPTGKQHIDVHTCMEHAVPNCNSDEVFRGIIADESKAVFSGRIHIHRDAQNTDAKLSNKNLLTSNKAEVDTKPELEIYADDVRCAHGATVAQLDETALHYFRTRGVSTEEARVMLNFGFINELINDLKSDAIVQHLRPRLASLFARDPDLARHIS